MPPESWTGKTTEQSDQYSLAGSYVELRLNRHLFPCEDMASAMLDHLQKTPELDPLPNPEQQVLLKALAKDPVKRFANCMEFWEALQQAVGPAAGKGSSSGDVAAAPQGRPSGQAHTLNFGQLDTDDRPLPTAAAGAVVVTPPPVVDHDRRQRRYIAAGLAAVTAVVAIGMAVAFWPRSGGDTPPVPPEEVVAVPDGFQKTDDAKTVTVDGRPLYERIARVLPDKTELVMVLVPKSRPADPDPFYILRDKVTNHAFGHYARENPAAVRDSKWEGGPEGPNAIPLGARDFPFHPVLRVSVDEADGFARWLGGRLPSADQWDKAAGRFDGAVGPFAGDGQGLGNEDFGVGLDRLLPVNRPTKAVTLFGCRDMAGNGYEWTRSVYGDERQDVPFDDPSWNGRVSLRGQTYFAPNPYRFADRPNSRYRFKNPQNGEPGGSAEVSFRVILPLPPP
jgi:hypothetical protein